MGVTAKKFGELTSGEEITLYHLENQSGAYWRGYGLRCDPL